MNARKQLPGRILCMVTDLERAGGEHTLLRAVADGVRGGVNMVQVRAHELDEGALEGLAVAVVELVGDEAVVVVNGEPRVAVAAGAHGLHFPEREDFDRSNVPDGLLIGQSVHSAGSARKAEDGGANYIILGTVFPSASHPGGPTGGIELVAEVASAVKIPVIGIGGITGRNAGEVIAAGASGVAVISAIIGSDNPLQSAKTLAEAVGAR